MAPTARCSPSTARPQWMSRDNYQCLLCEAPSHRVASSTPMGGWDTYLWRATAIVTMSPSCKQKENSLAVDAAGPPCDLPAQTVADGNPPGGTAISISITIIPGRVYVPIQSTEIKKSRQALLPPRAASVGRRARSPGADPSPRSQDQSETTICRGWVSQADTHLPTL